MHGLPAFHDPNTVVGREMMENTGMSSGLEVTGQVFEPPASIVFDKPRTGGHRQGALGATLGARTTGHAHPVALGGNALPSAASR